jgi:hypothetical protein
MVGGQSRTSISSSLTEELGSDGGGEMEMGRIEGGGEVEAAIGV